MTISIIIPTLNEESHIGSLLHSLTKNQGANLEIIVVDGGSKDETLAEVEAMKGVKLLHSQTSSRASQMNLGAKNAKGDILYFVHADVSLPDTFFTDIQESLGQGNDVGCFRFKFINKPYRLLCINDFFTRFGFGWCRGGDQTLFIKRDLFEQMNGFDERFVIMEDYDFLDRLPSESSFHIIPKSVGVSARKYFHNSYMKVQMTNFKAMRMYRRGIEPKEIKSFYQNTLA